MTIEREIVAWKLPRQELQASGQRLQGTVRCRHDCGGAIGFRQRHHRLG